MNEELMFPFTRNRRSASLLLHKKALKEKADLLSSWSPELRKSSRFIQKLLSDRSTTGLSHGEQLSSTEQLKLEQCLVHLTWPAAVVSVSHGNQFGAQPCIFELAADPQIVAALGWGTLARLLRQLGTNISQIQRFHVLLRRQLFALLATLDDQRAAHGAVAATRADLMDCIKLLYAAIGGDGAGDILVAPYQESDCASLTQSHLRVTRVADWLVREKRWNALSACVNTLTDPKHVPDLLLKLPILQSVNNTSTHVISCDPAELACKFIAKLVAAATTAHAELTSRNNNNDNNGGNEEYGTVLNGGVPSRKIARTHRTGQFERVEVLELVWAYLVDASPSVFTAIISPLLRGLEPSVLQYRSPCSGNALIHFAAARHHAPLVALLMKIDASNGVLLSTVHLKRHLCNGKLPLQVALEHHARSISQHSAGVSDAVLPLIEAAVVEQYFDTTKVPTDAVESLLATCIGNQFGQVLERIMTCMTPEQYAFHFRTLATHAASCSEVSILHSVFSPRSPNSPLSLALILERPPGGDRSPLSRAIALDNVPALEAMQYFASKAAVPDNAADLSKTCIEDMVRDYVMCGGSQLYFSNTLGTGVLRVQSRYGLANAECLARLLEAQRSRQKRLAAVMSLVTDLLNDHLQAPDGLSFLKVSLTQLRVCDPDGPHARWIEELESSVPLLQKARQCALGDADKLHVLILGYARQQSSVSAHAKETMSMLVSEFLLATTHDVPLRLRLAEQLIEYCARRRPTAQTSSANQAILGWLCHIDELCEGYTQGDHRGAWTGVPSLCALRRHALTSAFFPDRDVTEWQLWMLYRLSHSPPVRFQLLATLHNYSSLHDENQVVAFRTRFRVEVLLTVHNIIHMVYVGAYRHEQLLQVMDALLRLEDGATVCSAVVAVLRDASEMCCTASSDVIDEPDRQCDRPCNVAIFNTLLEIVREPEWCPSFPRRIDVLEALLLCLNVSCGQLLIDELNNGTPKLRLLNVVGLLTTSADGIDNINTTVWSEAVDVVASALATDLDALFPEDNMPVALASIVGLSSVLGGAALGDCFFERSVRCLKNLIATSLSSGLFASARFGVTMVLRPIGKWILRSFSRTVTLLAGHATHVQGFLQQERVVALCALSISANWLTGDEGHAPKWLPHLVAHVSMPANGSAELGDGTLFKQAFCRQIWSALLYTDPFEVRKGHYHCLGSFNSRKIEQLLVDLPFVPKVKEAIGEDESNRQSASFDAITESVITAAHCYWNHSNSLLDTAFFKRVHPGMLKKARPSTQPSPKLNKTTEELLCDQWLGRLRFLHFRSTQRPSKFPTELLSHCLLTAFGWLANTSSSDQHFQLWLSELHELLPESSLDTFVASLVAGVQLFQHAHVAQSALQWVRNVRGDSLRFSLENVRAIVETLVVAQVPEDEGELDEERENRQQEECRAFYECLRSPQLPFLESALRQLAAQQLLLEHLGLTSCNSVVAGKEIFGMCCGNKAFWCATGLHLFFMQRGYAIKITSSPPGPLDSAVAQVLQENPSVVTPLVDATLRLSKKIGSYKLCLLGDHRLCELVWRPYFMSQRSLATWQEDNSHCLVSAPVKSCLLDVLQVPDQEDARALKHELECVMRSATSTSSHMPLSALFEEAMGEADADLVAMQLREQDEGRLSQAQLAHWSTSTSVPPQTPRLLLRQHLSLQVPHYWNVSVEGLSDDVRHCLTSERIATLSLPLQVTQHLQSCTDAAHRWRELDMLRFRTFLEEMGSGDQRHPFLAMHAFLAANTPRRHPINPPANRQATPWAPALTLNITLVSGASPWRLCCDEGGTMLRLHMSLDADPRDGTVELPEYSAGGGVYGMDAQRFSPRVVLAPLASVEEDRVVRASAEIARAGQRLIIEFMRIALGASTVPPAKGDGVHFVQRSVDEVIRDMLDAGLPEVTLGLLQVMLTRHQKAEETFDEPVANTEQQQQQQQQQQLVENLSRQVSSATSIDEDDLLCCVCLSNSLLHNPVMLSCFHLICETCVKSLCAHGKRKCPICNAFSVGSPKIRVVLPERPSTTTSEGAGDAANMSSPLPCKSGIVSDEFSGAPSFVATLCRLVLKDLHALGLPPPNLQAFRSEMTHPRVHIYIFLSQRLKSMRVVTRWLRLLADKIRPIAKVMALERPILGHSYASSRASSSAMFNYMLGPQPPVAAALRHCMMPVATWCVQTWTWVGSTISTEQSDLSEDAMREVAANFGAVQSPSARRLYDSEDASLRETAMNWEPSAPWQEL